MKSCVKHPWGFHRKLNVTLSWTKVMQHSWFGFIWFREWCIRDLCGRRRTRSWRPRPWPTSSRRSPGSSRWRCKGGRRRRSCARPWSPWSGTFCSRSSPRNCLHPWGCDGPRQRPQKAEKCISSNNYPKHDTFVVLLHKFLLRKRK